MVLIENLNSGIRFYVPLFCGIILSLSAFAAVLKHRLLPAAFLVAAGAGLLISISFNLNATPAWAGIPAGNAAVLKGMAASDSRKLSTGNFLLEMELSSVCNDRGGEASAGGKVMLFFNEDPNVGMGRILEVEAALLIPGNTSELYETQKAGSLSLIKDPAVFISYPSEGSLLKKGWSSASFRIRASILESINFRCEDLGEEAGGLFAALFTGNRDGLSGHSAGIFRKAGCSHILALSGMHLGILSAILLLLLKPLPGKVPAFIISCIVISGYLFLTGFGVSLVRAAVMYLYCGLATVFYRKFRALDILLLSFITLVIFQPESFYTVSFQLSFLAVGGIIIASPIIYRMLCPWLPSVLCAALSCSIGAQLFVTPLLLTVFGELYPVGIAAGIVIAPIVTVFIWIGILYLATGLAVFSTAAQFLYKAVIVAAEKAAGFPCVSAATQGRKVILLCAIVVLVLVVYSIYRRKMDGLSGKL